MIWNPFRRQRRSHERPSARQNDIQSVIDIIEQVLSAQLSLAEKNPREYFSTFMTNKLAAGYVFGLHDACFQIFGHFDPNNRAAGMSLLEQSYKRIFGEQAGFVLIQSSIRWQMDDEFSVGRQSGGEDFVEFNAQGTPTLGLQRILCLGFDVSMVKRTLTRP